MTKQQANEIKKCIKPLGNYTVYFNSKKGELRYTVAQWQDGQKCDADALEKKNTIAILNALTAAGLRPSYKKAYCKYQGFINYSYIVFQ